VPRDRRFPLPKLGLCLVPVLFAAILGSAVADNDVPRDLPLPRVFDKATPESVEDLVEIQNHVKKVLEKVVPCTVGLRIGPSQGSGVIVSKDGYVLTAGHVSGQADRDVLILLHDGRKLKGKTLGANRSIDSGMVKITDEGTWPYIDLGLSSDLKKGQWCIAVGHPGGVKPGRTPVVRVGRVLDRTKSLIRTDCTLVGGDSGGPLFDMTGKVIGIHSRIGQPITANIHVPVDTYRDTWDRLAKAEVWGNAIGSPVNRPLDVYMGIQHDPDAKNCRIVLVAPDSPAAKAGLKVDDVLTGFNGKRIGSFEDLADLLRGQRPGNEVNLEVKRGDDLVMLKLTLSKRPS
jgi:serine protease Do